MSGFLELSPEHQKDNPGGNSSPLPPSSRAGSEVELNMIHASVSKSSTEQIDVVRSFEVAVEEQENGKMNG